MSDHYNGFDTYDEVTFLNVLCYWLTDELGCVVAADQSKIDVYGYGDITINLYENRFALIIDKKLIVNATIYDPKGFESLKSAIETQIMSK